MIIKGISETDASYKARLAAEAAETAKLNPVYTIAAGGVVVSVLVAATLTFSKQLGVERYLHNIFGLNNTEQTSGHGR